VTPENLYLAALVFGIATTIIVIMIYAFLYIKKRRYRINLQITDMLNEWISEALVEKTLPQITIPDELWRHFKKKRIREFITTNLINAKKNVTGSGADNIITIYELLELKEDSIRKMKSMTWHRRARGIYELYMMDQRNELPDVFDYTNSRNEYVRMEAQTALIGLRGFDGLVFLDTLDYPLTEWQQIKLLEQLASLNVTEMNHLPLWLQSQNLYVVQFALKLVDIYQQLQVHDEVVACLANPNAKIRYQAIKALGRIANAHTAGILKTQYETEIPINKQEILRQIAVIGTDADTDFLVSKLNEEDDALILEAGRAMITVSNDGWNILEKQTQNDDKLQSIVRQIKYEAA
jgi:hypothetical protein